MNKSGNFGDLTSFGAVRDNGFRGRRIKVSEKINMQNLERCSAVLYLSGLNMNCDNAELS